MSHSDISIDDPAAPRAGTSPWRVAVVGTVAVLALAIGLAVGAFVSTSRASVVGAGAAYVPAEAAFYLELQLEPSAEQDAAARELLGRFPAVDGVDLGRPLADQLAELLDEALAEEDLDLSWSEDIAPWTDGRVALAMLELPKAALDPMADPAATGDVPPMVLLLGVTDAGTARASVARLLDEADVPALTTTEHRGVTIHAAADGDGAYAITGDQLIAAPSADDIAAALDAEAGGTTLAERDDIGSLVEALPDGWLAFGIFDFTSAMQTALDAGGAESAASADALRRIMEHQSMRAAFSISVSDTGLHFDSAGTPPTGPFAVGNGDRGLAAAVPADTLYFAEGGSIGPALAEIIGAMKEAAAAVPDAVEVIATAEAALGAELEELVSWIDDGAMAIGWDGSEPYGGLVLVPSDMAAAERRFDQLATFARLAAMDPSIGITVDEGSVAGVTVTSVRWEDASMSGMMMGAPIPVSVQYALTDDRVLIGIGDAFVGRVLELDPGDSLAGVDRYTEAIDAVGGPNAAGTAWVDLAGIVTAVEGVAGEMMGDGADDLLEWLRPLDRLVGVGRLDGDVLVQRSILIIR